MKQYEKWAYEYWYKLMEEYHETKDPRKKVLAKIKKYNTKIYWLDGFEFGMKILFMEEDSPIGVWHNTEHLEGMLNKEVEPPKEPKFIEEMS